MEAELSYQRGVAGLQELQAKALVRADIWLLKAKDQPSPRAAADLSLAAKNAASVAVALESILKMRNGGGR